MNRFLTLTVFFLCFFGLGLKASGDDFASRDRALRELSLRYKVSTLAPSSGDFRNPTWRLTVAPAFNYSSHKAITTVINGTNLKSDGGHSSTGGLYLSGAKALGRVAELSLNFLLAHTSYSGGLLTPNIAGFGGSSEVKATSNQYGVAATFKTFIGNFELAYAKLFHRYSGEETIVVPMGISQTRNMDMRHELYTLGIWWERDFPVNETWTINPYAGWRHSDSTITMQNNWNDWTGGPGAKTGNGAKYDQAVGGARLKYSAGPLGVNFRLAYSYRASKNDIPIFSSRTLGPGVVTMGYYTGFDRSVVGYGVDVSFFSHIFGVLDLAYNGARGADANFHNVTLAFVYFF
jgi:hypothetical protein